MGPRSKEWHHDPDFSELDVDFESRHGNDVFAKMKALSLLTLTCCFFLLRLSAVAADEDYLTYDRFISEVESGSIKSATLDRFSRISGSHLVNGAERPFLSYGEVGSANDILLNRLLEEHKVAVTLKERKDENGITSNQSILTGAIMLFIPILTFLLVLRINSKVDRLAGHQSTPDAHLRDTT